MTGRVLIVNADDFGMCHTVNRGIIQAHEQGIVTSASLMVRHPAAAEAAEYAQSNGSLSVGLHLDLGEWILKDSEWTPKYEVVSLDDPTGVGAEIDRQLELFYRLAGRLPTHIDSHQHVHRREPVRALALKKASELGLALRSENPNIRYCGAFYGQTSTGLSEPERVSTKALVEIIRTLPPGSTELACHPGASETVSSAYARERVAELNALCDPEVRSAIQHENIKLSSFKDLAHTTLN